MRSISEQPERRRQTPGCKRLQVANNPLRLVTSGIGASPLIEFRLLGPFEVLVDGRPAELGGARPKAILAILLLNRGTVISGETLERVDVHRVRTDLQPVAGASGDENAVP